MNGQARVFTGLLGTTLVVAAIATCASSAARGTPSANVNVSARSQAAPSLPQTSGRTSIELGVGLGPLQRVDHYGPALARIRQDGFRIVRVYEPFRRAQGAGYGPIIEDLATLDQQGFTPYFDISNFPFNLAPAGNLLAASHAEWPAARRSEAFQTTNRYPPNAPEFDAALGELLQRLEARFGRARLESWYFEIGNEPDARQFFWGSPDEFVSLLHTAMSRFHAFDANLKIGGAAFTAGLVARGADKNPQYVALARELASGSGSFASAHVYSTSFPDQRGIGADLNALFGAPTGGLRVISEWNIGTEPGPRVLDVLHSPDAVVPFLVDLLAAAQQAGVSIILEHKLQDEPGGKEQLGLFDADGQPKGAYAWFARIAQFARQGFSVTRDGDAVKLVGDSLTFVHAGSRPVALEAGARVIAPAGVSGTVPANGWAVLQR